MLFFDGALSLVLFGLWVFCLFDVVTTDDSQCRNLQKTWWILIVVLLFDVGAVFWLVAGRPWPASIGANLPYRGNLGPVPPKYPEDDDDFLRQVRERAEEQRRRHREQQRRSDED